MAIEIRHYLYDIQQAGQPIPDCTQGQTDESYQANSMTDNTSGIAARCCVVICQGQTVLVRPTAFHSVHGFVR